MLLDEYEICCSVPEWLCKPKTRALDYVVRFVTKNWMGIWLKATGSRVLTFAPQSLMCVFGCRLVWKINIESKAGGLIDCSGLDASLGDARYDALLLLMMMEGLLLLVTVSSWFDDSMAGYARLSTVDKRTRARKHPPSPVIIQDTSFVAFMASEMMFGATDPIEQS